MLKLLLNHWQVHREAAPFVLTDDPLYCAHLSTTASQLPEVYSVNRVNPIFEEDEESSVPNYSNHKRTHSENETRSSDDTGYISGHRKLIHSDDFYDQHLSSDDSDELPKSVVISADVHRESNPEDIITPSNITSTSTCTYCTSSLSSGSSPEPYDSLTASNDSPTSFRNISVRNSMKINIGALGSSQQTEVKTPVENFSNMDAREKIERLLQQGNLEPSRKGSAASQNTTEINDRKSEDMETSRSALMQSLTRALHQKVPNADSAENPVTRIDSTIKNKKKKTMNTVEKGEAVLPPSLKPEQGGHETNTSVTRRDESVSTNSSSNTSRSANSRKSHRHHKHNVPKPITLHQLLPGHWSYDNIYLPQMSPGICYHCLQHHNPTLLPVSESELFFPPLYHHSSRSRHSWAPQTIPLKPHNFKERQKRSNHSSKEDSSSTERRYSPDGSSQETESDGQLASEKVLRRKSAEERRSLRVPKKCKCEDCLSVALDGADGPFPKLLHVSPTCPCCYLPHRRVKFASDTDLTKHIVSEDYKLTIGDKFVNPTFPINLHRLNGHVKDKSNKDLEKDGSSKSKNSQSTTSRGQKEPIKMDDLYRSYPINFQDWEAHYRRKFLLRRRKRALNMIGMAIGIILVIGVAIAMTFIFLKLKRPS